MIFINDNNKKNISAIYEEELSSVDKTADEILKSVGNVFNKEIKPELNKINPLKKVFPTKEQKLANRITEMMQYLAEEDIHEIAEKIYNDDSELIDIDLVSIFPYFNEEDSNKIFRKKVESNDIIVCELVNFVDEESLSLLVDAYLEGRFPNLVVEKLYPLLDKETVKKIFYYEVNKSKK